MYSRPLPDAVDLDWSLLCDTGDGLLHLDHPTDHLFLLMQESFDAESRMLELRKDFAGWSERLRASHSFRANLPPAFVGSLCKDDLHRLRSQIPYYDAIGKVSSKLQFVELLDHEGARDELRTFRLELRAASDETRDEIRRRVSDAQILWTTRLIAIQTVERDLLQKAHEFLWRLTELLDMDLAVQCALSSWTEGQRAHRLAPIFSSQEYREASSLSVQSCTLDRKLRQLVKRTQQPLRRDLLQLTHQRIAWFERAVTGFARAEESRYASCSAK